MRVLCVVLLCNHVGMIAQETESILHFSALNKGNAYEHTHPQYHTIPARLFSCMCANHTAHRRATTPHSHPHCSSGHPTTYYPAVMTTEGLGCCHQNSFGGAAVVSGH